MKPAKRDFNKKKVLSRLFKYLYHTYPKRTVIILICIVITAIGSLAASLFMPQFIDNVIYVGIENGFDSVKGTMISLIIALSCVYACSPR